jgi:type IV secretory pathway TraG/TraD family ATPase VirD4
MGEEMENYITFAENGKCFQLHHNNRQERMDAQEVRESMNNMNDRKKDTHAISDFWMRIIIIRNFPTEKKYFWNKRQKNGFFNTSKKLYMASQKSPRFSNLLKLLRCVGLGFKRVNDLLLLQNLIM